MNHVDRLVGTARTIVWGTDLLTIRFEVDDYLD